MKHRGLKQHGSANQVRLKLRVIYTGTQNNEVGSAWERQIPSTFLLIREYTDSSLNDVTGGCYFSTSVRIGVQYQSEL